jgi:hypothetical protein
VICGGKVSPPKYKATETPFDRHEARGIIFQPDLAFPFFERKDGNAKAAWSDNPTDAVREYGTSWGRRQSRWLLTWSAALLSLSGMRARAGAKSAHNIAT